MSARCNEVQLILESNQIEEVPESIQMLTNLEKININKNKLKSVFKAVDSLSRLRRLTSLFINLSEESQVDYIMKKLPDLQLLNGLEVDRELEEEEEEEDDDDEEEEETPVQNEKVEEREESEG